MTRRRNGPRKGFTLIEALVVMWALMMAFGLGIVLLVAALRADRVCQATLRNVTWRSAAADQFRADVARAEDVPDSLGEVQSGPACLILRMPEGHHVVYRAQNEMLERVARAADGTETRRLEPVGPPESKAEFEHTGGKHPLIVLRFIDRPAAGAEWRTEVSAALGGDRR